MDYRKTHSGLQSDESFMPLRGAPTCDKSCLVLVVMLDILRGKTSSVRAASHPFFRLMPIQRRDIRFIVVHHALHENDANPQ
jgi:hypothetical protein